MVETLWIRIFLLRVISDHLCTNNTKTVDSPLDFTCHPQSSTEPVLWIHSDYTGTHSSRPREIRLIHTIHTTYDDDYLSSQGR